MKKTKPILYDPLIINRVKQYLEENVHQTYLDVGVMAKSLQDRYPEYSRRKIAPFRSLVEQAYKVVSQSYGLDVSPPSPDSGSDLEVMDEPPVAQNSMNNMLTNLYAKKSNPKDSSMVSSGGGGQQGGNNSELIDISSDDGSDDEKAQNGKSKGLLETPGETLLKYGEVTCRKVVTSDGNSTPPDSGLPKRAATPTSLSKKRKRDRSNSPEKGDHKESGVLLLKPPNRSNSNDNTAAADSFVPLLRQRKYKKELRPKTPRLNFQDVGGMENVLKELCEILMHVKQPDIYFMLGLMPPRGLLLHGPSGCGKTLLAHAIAGQLGMIMLEVAATELIAGVSGESEERIRDIFEQAVLCAPCVLFIDEIDAISSNRSNAQRDMERRIVSQLISCMDGLKTSDKGQSVLVIGATTRPDVLDPALRRVSRFDHEIAIGIPSRKDRKEILTIICDGLSISPKMDFDKIAEVTPGYVGADMLALVSRAATIAVKRECSQQMKELQMKNQRNITIVDLIDETQTDDNEASNKKDKSQTDADKSIKESDKSKIDESTVEKPSKDCSDEADKTATEAETTTTTTTTTTDEKETEDKVKESTEANGSTDDMEKMEVEDDDLPVAANEEKSDDKNSTKEADKSAVANEEPIDVDDLPEEKERISTESMPEPTLFEMINMLDNASLDIGDISDFCITLEDFKEAVKVIQPSAKREGFITVPDVTWDDVGSLQDIREELKLAVLAPVKFPEKLAKLGLTAPSGVLLCGPPGCGKTLLAKAIANEAGINFISVKGPEMMNMYVGESERAVRACFQRARNSAPCVIFFDEFDSLCPKRSDNHDSGSGTRIVNQLLTEMDGVEDRKGVYILAATNRPDIIDPAILRPGRLDTILYVGLPQQKDRVEILTALTKNRTRPVLAEDIDFEDLATKSEGYTGADLAGLVRQAAMLALKESINNPDIALDDICVKNTHFEEAISLLRPSVSAQDRKVYEKLKEKYAAPRLSNENK
ncbi:nuclear valosin-containing protein-like isoform X2 [Episyrphus balteatus]|uniref:nuclear valosin-containing protein-like isoform X2 n=1 Tax=Episyrphus balteatus TaxID=286459 RepID=UPI0024862831|nr:nuclear valosin-containing protein-like isoform X2 [Episyrphus balteatus]